MDRNFLLACALSLLVVSLWTMSQAPRPDPAGTGKPPRESTEAVADVPVAERGDDTARFPTLQPSAPPPAGPTDDARAPRAPAPSGPSLSAAPGQTFLMKRPLYEADLSSRGATLRRFELRRYVDRHGDPIHLVDAEDALPTLATPFLELGFGDLSDEIWSAEALGNDGYRFTLERDGVVLRKTYQFPADGYDFRLLIEVENDSGQPVAPAFLAEWPIQERDGNDFREQSAAAFADGDLEVELLGGLGSPGFFGRLGGKQAGEPVVLEGEIDWAGIQTPYFLGALFPDQPSAAHGRFVAIDIGRRGAVQLYFDPVTLPSGQRAAREYRVYAGPKEIERLEAFAPSAAESIDLGWSIIAPMTRAFGWLLAVLYSFVPNYGVAIILLTLLVRVVTAPLTLKQMKSMERMRRIQPQLKEIQEKHKDDRQKQSEAMMSLYRQEKVNPLGGCVPMLFQLPVFIGLFYALRSSIQLRQAPFVAWIDDLSAPDLLFTLPGVDFPIRLLPLLMGASMFVQQKITPMQIDPAQARMMMILMPVMLTFISYQFPSGLVLYWMLSNVLAIGHQLWIGRNMEPATGTKEK